MELYEITVKVTYRIAASDSEEAVEEVTDELGLSDDYEITDCECLGDASSFNKAMEL